MDADRSLLHEFIRGGWLVTILGGAGMAIRLCFSDGPKYTIIEQFKRISAAAAAATIAWFVLEQTDIASLYKAISYGIVGVISPEIIHGIIKIAKRFEKNPEKFVHIKGDDGNKTNEQ